MLLRLAAFPRRAARSRESAEKACGHQKALSTTRGEG